MVRDLIGPEGHRTPVQYTNSSGSTILKGAMVLIAGIMYGIAYADIADGEVGTLYIWYDRAEVDKASATVLTAGQKLFIDPATGLALADGTGTGKECGVVLTAGPNGTTTVEAIFNGAKTV